MPTPRSIFPSKKQPRRFGRAAIIAPALLVLAACASAGTTTAHEQPAFIPAASISGNYLSGMHANARGDIPRAIDYFQTIAKQRPDDVYLWKLLYVLNLSGGDMNQATAFARLLLKNHINVAYEAYLVPVDDLVKGRMKQADAILSGLPSQGLHMYLRPLIRAWIKVASKDYDGALKALRPLSKKKDIQPLYAMHEGMIQALWGHQDKAEKLLEQANNGEDGPSYRTTIILGNLYERAGKPNQARRVYQNYITQSRSGYLLDDAMARLKSGRKPAPAIRNATDGLAEGLFGIASSLRRDHVNEPALDFARMALVARPHFPAAQILLADIYEQEGQIQAANAVYRQIDPASAFAWDAKLRMADNLNALGQIKNALKLLEAQAKAYPDRPAPLIQMGDILRHAGRFSEAVNAYDRAFARIKNPDERSWSLYYARGVALEQAKQWPRAEADLLKALSLNPNQPNVLNYLGYSWMEQGEHLDRALEMVRQAVLLRPRDGYIVDSLGWGLYRIGHYAEAVREMERAVLLVPEDPVINDHLGDVYWQVGRRQEARFQWNHALFFGADAALKKSIENKLKNGLPPHKVPRNATPKLSPKSSSKTDAPGDVKPEAPSI
ncbi:tetratricopeptide repeat protein [Varunaivibrio sulfuroxidans]|nr:tetratricopeptide repeat protein [Varunaivibrio sulfuroxidans]WES30300.1 tetratricopeptide repeat protein [Varunaivibrio sulfuroxidans]